MLIATNYQLSNLDLSERNKQINKAHNKLHNSLDEANIERFVINSNREGNSAMSNRIGY